jgi:hypothetical protein
VTLKPGTLRLTAEMIENLTALSGVAYEKLGAIFLFLIASKPAPKIGYWDLDVKNRGSQRWRFCDTLAPSTERAVTRRRGRTRLARESELDRCLE